MAVALAFPAAAAAHAELLGTQPANEATVDERPDEVTISFSEDVTVAFGGIKAWGPDGDRVEGSDVRVDGDTIHVPLEVEQPGTHAVAWRAISTDGHPVRGAFVFHVEQRTKDAASRDRALRDAEGSVATEFAFAAARGLVLLGVLGATGAMLFWALVAPDRRPWRLRSALALALVASFAAFVLDAMIAAGLTVVDALRADVLREQLTTIYGQATSVRIVLLVACLALAWSVLRRPDSSLRGRLLLLAPFVALAASLSLSGHAVGDQVTPLRLPLDMLHSIAAAAWLGGLLQLLHHVSRPDVDPRAVERFSRLALCSVVVLVLTGLWASWEEIGLSLEGVTDTAYGRLVAAKALLLAATLPLANVNRVRNVPAVVAGADDAVPRLRRYVLGELGILVLVVALTAWLVQAVPATAELRPDFVEKTVQLGQGGSVQLVIDPASVGSNEVHVYAYDTAQQPDGDITTLTLTARNDERGLGPLEIELQPAGPGHFTTPVATIPFAGTWRFDVSVQRGEFEEERARFSARIASQRQGAS